MAKVKPHLPADLDLDALVATPGAGRPPPAFHEAPVQPPQLPPPASPEEPSAAARQPADLKAKVIATTFYLLPADHRRLRRLAADREVAAQTLLLDALDALFQQAGEGPVQRWEPRRKVRQ